MKATSALAGALTVLAATFFLPAHAAGDAERGAVLSDTCMGCHGIPRYNNTYPAYRVPKIGGQNSGYIAAALKAYRSGDRAHPTMRAQAALMTDEDIADIAAHFSQAPQY